LVDTHFQLCQGIPFISECFDSLVKFAKTKPDEGLLAKVYNGDIQKAISTLYEFSCNITYIWRKMGKKQLKNGLGKMIKETKRSVPTK
jgi:hypothetical protein